MSDLSQAKAGQLDIVLATWIFLLHDAGHVPDEASLCAAIDALRDAPEGADPDVLGQALVRAVRASLGEGSRLSDVSAWLSRIYGEAHVSTDFGADRDSRVQSARRHHFGSSLPWLARIIDRFPGGEVGAHWLLVERLDEEVTCMDPYPWDELDEQYRQPLVEFLVKWELAGGEGIRFVG